MMTGNPEKILAMQRELDLLREDIQDLFRRLEANRGAVDYLRDKLRKTEQERDDALGQLHTCPTCGATCKECECMEKEVEQLKARIAELEGKDEPNSTDAGGAAERQLDG